MVNNFNNFFFNSYKYCLHRNKEDKKINSIKKAKKYDDLFKKECHEAFILFKSHPFVQETGTQLAKEIIKDIQDLQNHPTSFFVYQEASRCFRLKVDFDRISYSIDGKSHTIYFSFAGYSDLGTVQEYGMLDALVEIIKNELQNQSFSNINISSNYNEVGYSRDWWMSYSTHNTNFVEKKDWFTPQ